MKQNSLLKRNGLLLVSFTALISGISIFVNGFGVKGFDSSVFTFSKNLMVALLLAGILLGFREWKHIRELTGKQWRQLSIVGLVGGSIPFLLFFKGLQMTTGKTSGFIHKTLFIYATILAIIFLKERWNRNLVLGITGIMAGNYLLIRPDLTFSTGHILILLATLFWAAENVYAKKVMRELSGTVVGFGRMAFGSAFIFVYLLVTGKTETIVSMNASQYLWILVTSAFLLLYVFTYYNGLRQVRVSTATGILALGSPITTLLAFLFTGKVISASAAGGMLLIIVGVAAIVWGVPLSTLKDSQGVQGVVHGRS
ncbi:MAG: DMT family transporter [DPANN group archaeon]|nr:DMT family transporter [DPANN group archaeon]